MENKEQSQSDSTNVEVVPEEECVTVGEILEGFKELEETANVLFAAQDPSVCTFPEGYKPRQTVFTCLTCTPEPQTAGVCYGCSLNCHDGHDIVELYTKRKFCCDCGNPKFGDKKCALYEDKPKENEYNKYNHNYHGKFCTCDVFYPDDDKETGLYQCEVCEDWYHYDHVPFNTISYETEVAAEEEKSKVHASAICAACIKKIPFVAQIPPGKDVFCHSRLTPEQLAIPESLGNKSLHISNFRQRLCKCPDCIRVYELADCEFLTEVDDDIATFENESKKAAAEEKESSEDDEMRDLVKEVGMDGARVFYEGLNQFKRKFAEFVTQAGQGGKVITEEDVKKFSENLQNDMKRPRLE